MKKLRELIDSMYKTEGLILKCVDERFVRKLKFQQKESELLEKRNKKLEEANNFMRRMDIATGWSSANHRLIVDYLREDRKLEDKIAEINAELDGIKNAIRERGKKLSKNIHISHGMMAEALTEYFVNYDDGTAWKVLKVCPYLFNSERGCFEHRFGTYIVSDNSSNFAGEEIYTLNDPENEFPKAIAVAFGRGSKTDVQIAQEKLDKINWFEIYLQGLVGGMEIPRNLAVLKSVGEADWDGINEVFERVILPKSEFELNDEEQSC